jgi:RES domain-containing protein
VTNAVVWRIARRPYALDRVGLGARENGGRWNLPGTGVIYAGCSIAVAALERFVHLAAVVPPDLVLVRIDLPARYSSEEPPLADLPPDWNAMPAAQSSRRFGTQWARELRSLVLYIPSALVQEEGNAVLNPSHPEFTQVTMTVEREFRYGPRMFQARAARHRG